MADLIMAGQPFGRGVVLDPDVGRLRRGILVRLRCAPERGGCGTTYEATAGKLRSGDVQSCGCLLRDRPHLTTHGLSRHPLYPTWQAMISRCEDTADPAWPRYGGRGITVCPEWHDVARFIADILAEIGPRPDGLTLNRIDNERGYERGNVEWASRAEQSRNRGRGALSAVQMAERNRRIAALWRAGWSRQQIAGGLGVSYGAVAGIIRHGRW